MMSWVTSESFQTRACDSIDYDFRFDDAMANIGCTVYSFDPSMLDTPDHKRGDRVFFKRIGISDKDDDHFVPRVDEYVEKRRAVNGWPMRRLQTILDQLGHKKEQLTVLKMDIEGYEWDVTRDLLDSGILSSVPQFLVEWHLFKDFPPRERVPDAVETYFRLNDMGFQLFVTGIFYLGSATSLRMTAETFIPVLTGADKRALWTVPWWGRACDMESDWSRERYQCQDKRQMGNWPVCFDKNLIPQSNCLVYSFGIDYDFRFDDAMANIGCTVYSFDPSMLDTPDHKRGDRVFFKRMGISDKDDDHFVPRVDEYVEKRRAVNGWPMRRLQTILDQLGHKKEQLTVLKLDIEGYEWDVTRDLLDSGILSSVPQFLVEWHLFTDFPPRERVPDAVDTYFRF
ncbi:hypothetical protein C0Q70_06375 [Pomacea canaliculata]|uniref:Methyltransferase domain-containing protein n=1 Tax=Pomacea canaliculata TaxID=400727 RepID=A0A2T7PNU4_POMCA|nr:hypothetical protein C0Q70_06375 [Pomacea canaliculata]